jgi:hypothetical protein
MSNALVRVAALLLVLAFPLGALATWKPEYAQLPQEVRDWYAHAQTTEAARPRLPYKAVYCCEHAEVVHTKFKVNKTDGADEWFYQLPDGSWKQVPSDIIHWGESAPGGQPTLFIYSGVEMCFWPPEGGI